MGSIIFLPGILGSALHLGTEEVWPPTPWEAQFGYDRIDKLVDPAVSAGKPIEAVLCFEFYGPILGDLADIALGTVGAPQRSMHSFGYDWRVDIRDAAADIAGRIDALPDEDRAEIHLVGHSMGCLVLRLILESGVYDDRGWLANVRTLVSIAGPHLGAPAALIRVTGLEGSAGLAPADIKRIAADPRYPALYQLLPAPGIAAVWNVRGGAIGELDLYDSEVAGALGLDEGNLARARAVHEALGRGTRPTHVEYVYLAGSGSDTWLRVDLSGVRASGRMGKEAGDGTVPLWSAVDPKSIHHAAPGAHDRVFRNPQIRALIFRALGANPPGVPFASITGKPLLSLFASQTIYAPTAQIDLTLVPAAPARPVAGELVIEHSDGSTSPPLFRPISRTSLSYAGAEAEQLKVRLGPLPRSGFYRVTFDGTHDTAPDGAALLGVSDAGGGAGGVR